MSRHRNTFVSAGVGRVAVIYGSTYVCDMTGHSSHSSSLCGTTTPAEEFQCDARAMHHGRTSLCGAARRVQHIPPRGLNSGGMHRRCTSLRSHGVNREGLKNIQSIILVDLRGENKHDTSRQQCRNVSSLQAGKVQQHHHLLLIEDVPSFLL